MSLWPFAHRQWVFQPPPCNCAEIEKYVLDACALRDEMASWPTPLEEWKRLQEMPILRPKGKPQPFVDTWSDTYQQVMNGTYLSTAMQMGKPVPLYESRRPSLWDSGSRLQLLPGESFEVGTILKRGDTRYRITKRLFDNTNTVIVEQVRRWP